MTEWGVDWRFVAWVVGLIIGWTVFLVGIIKWLIARMIANLDMRMAEQAKQWQRTDADLKRLMTELPLHYQRRDDAIREYTAMNTKLDRIYEILMRLMRKENND